MRSISRARLVRSSTVLMMALAASMSLVAAALDTAAVDEQVASTLDRFYALNENNKFLAQNAAGVLVFPKVEKGGIGIGGEHGNGALQKGGKTVGYYSVSGASIGLTLGLSSHSEVIIFQTPEALSKFMKSGDWSIGADTSVAVMKAGAGGVYDSETLKKPVIAFVFGQKGLMGDASLQGGKITRLASAN